MRQIASAIGALLWPPLGWAYAVLMLLRNGMAEESIIEPGDFCHTQLRHPIVLVRRAKWVPPGKAAITLGHRVYTIRMLPSTKLLMHEVVHVEQFERWGFFGCLWRYGYEQLLHGRYNHLELEAIDRTGVR